VHATDGVTVLPGRRVAMHLMAQPDVATMWMSDRMLIDQGIMSRALATAPSQKAARGYGMNPRPRAIGRADRIEFATMTEPRFNVIAVSWKP
jgi:hypothetical protein